MADQLYLEEQLLSKLTALECWAGRARRKCNKKWEDGAFYEAMDRCKVILFDAENLISQIEERDKNEPG